MPSFIRTSAPLLLTLLLVSTVWGQPRALKVKINKALDRGVEYLRTVFDDRGVEYRVYRTGMTAFAAWTLLEAGVQPDDPLIEKAARILRREAVRTRETYELATCILFFDRLGHPADEALIQGMSVRLLAGQNATGGWTYSSGLADATGEAHLQRYMEAALFNRNKPRKAVGKQPQSPQDLPLPIQRLLTQINKPGALNGDGSNTQFAMLALWVARRHGLPVDDALLKVGQFFRKTQFKDSSWSYELNPESVLRIPRITMTCAGLLGIALEHGVAKKQKQERVSLEDDSAANGGLGFLGSFLATSNPKAGGLLLPSENFNYFLFSMERMAVVYDLKKIGEIDWYLWGAEKLVESQAASGGWDGPYGAADTCFALLFLKRANVARDLTLELRGIAREPAVTPKKKNERERDPFDVPKIAPKDKKPQAKPAAGPEKETRGVPPCRDSRQFVEKLPQKGSQSRCGIKTEPEIATAQDLAGGRLGSARLQAALQRQLVLA